MNEYGQIVSWALVESDAERDLVSLWEGLKCRYEQASVALASHRWVDKNCCTAPPYTSEKARSAASRDLQPSSVVDRTPFRRKSACRQYYNEDVEELLDAFHTIQRLGRECTSEAHPLYGPFLEALSKAMFIVDSRDYQKLCDAWRFVDEVDSPPKSFVRKHCKTVIPSPDVLLERVQKAIDVHKDSVDELGLPLLACGFDDCWSLQRLHILRGCLSDPVLPSPHGGVIFTSNENIHLHGVNDDIALLPVYHSIRGSSQLEGFHVHQNRDITGSRVTGELARVTG